MNVLVDSVILRCPEPQDVEDLYRFKNDPLTAECLTGFRFGYSRRDVHEWIECFRTRTDELVWAIADKNTDRCIGHVGLYKIDFRIRTAQFGVLVGDPERRGTGIGTAVSKAVIEYAFSDLNLRRIWLSALDTNTRAIHVYEKIGFKKEGVMMDADYRGGAYRNVVIMAIVKKGSRFRNR